jgi:hypothetical protein
MIRHQKVKSKPKMGKLQLAREMMIFSISSLTKSMKIQTVKKRT